MGYVTLEEAIKKVEKKKDDYKRYNFERLKEEAFATFFDLAQESTSLEHLYLVSVAVPKVFFNIESILYVLNSRTNRLEKVCTSWKGLEKDSPGKKYDSKELDEIATLENILHKNTEFHSEPLQGPISLNGKWAFPIRGNQALKQWVSFAGIKGVFGFLVAIFPKETFQEDLFFLEKFANRIGYNLHQKLLIQQNLNHLKFINQLVADIEHNVISPNLYYMLYIKRLKKHLESYRLVQKSIKDLILVLSHDQAHQNITDELCAIYNDFSEITDKMEEEARDLERHYTHTSLFLETLFRKEHFLKGTYVLRKQPCNFKNEIIERIIDRYAPLFDKKGIHLKRTAGDVPEEEITLFVDKGLISQVFDNLMSNALKYTEPIKDPLGNDVKLVSIDYKILKNFFGDNMHGIRFNIFTTGRPLSPEESLRVFEEGYRVVRKSEAEGESKTPSGSGHGLYFVKNVVEIHGGKVGCEPEKYGNTFYFILPFNAKEEIASPIEDRVSRN
ncbi:MAG: HAMP domain-containing histidine kinase [Syntrophobacterales bacterium]|nr:HAMP domain-containing histidine kinase [Syntrophobacterales bacterium]